MSSTSLRAWRLGIRCVCQVVVTAWVLGIGVARANDWPHWGLNLQRHRASDESLPTATFVPRWRAHLPAHAEAFLDAIVASPAVADGYIVLANQDGSLHVLAADDGRDLWRAQHGGAIFGSPTIKRGRVYVATADGVVVCYRLADGARIWSRDLDSIFYGSPVAIEDAHGEGLLLATGFPQQSLLRLDMRTGKIVWATRDGAIQRSSQASVAVADGVAIVPVVDGAVYGVSLETGDVMWKYETGSVVYMSSPLVLGERVHLLAGDRSLGLHALDVRTGAPQPGWNSVVEVPRAVKTTDKALSHSVAASSLAYDGSSLLLQLRAIDAVDADDDAVPDEHRMSEWIVAVSPTDGERTWGAKLAARVSHRATDLPLLDVAPTPAVFAGPGRRRRWLAASSSLEGVVRVFDAQTGRALWSGTLTGPSRSSPVFANGLLHVATDRGTLETFAAQGNTAPAAPSVAEAHTFVTTTNARLEWSNAFDPEMHPVSYTLRWDSDGETLEDWAGEITTTQGSSAASLPSPLQEKVAYTYALRARDREGAWSPWSASYVFEARVAAPVSMEGQPVDSLAAALAGAAAGSTVTLGEGVVQLRETATLPPGVTLAGAGAGRTIIDAHGLSAAIRVSGSRPDAASIRDVFVREGAVGVDVQTNAHVVLRNVVLKGQSIAGVRIAADASADVINATITRATVAVESAGHASVRNSLIFNNGSGLVASAGGGLDSRYNDLFDNRVDYAGVVSGPGDLAQAVAFRDVAADDFRLKGHQSSTDKGDPSDPYEREPWPNGGRVNMGAFGNTTEAEQSESPSPPATADAGGDGAVEEGEVAPTRPNGCGCALGAEHGRLSGSWGVWLVLAGLWLRRRPWQRFMRRTP